MNYLNVDELKKIFFDTGKVRCGPNAERTGELKNFKIIKEQSSSAKVRRIKAIIDYKD